jgi:branched-chain amino acid transport system permease protein
MKLTLLSDRGMDARGSWRLASGALIVGGALLLVILTIAFGSDGRWETLLSTIGITAVAVIGYQLFVGNTGIVSFGHPAFVAIGAYTAGILAMPLDLKPLLLPDLPHWLAGIATGPITAILVGGVLALLFALIVGPAVLRLSGSAAGIMTFGLLVIVNELIRNAPSITKGNQTFFGIPRAVHSPMVYIVLAIALLISVAFKFSRAGLHARAVREEPLAAASAGIGLIRARMGAWCLSAFICGVSGAMLAQNLTAFSPSSFYVSFVIPLMLMAVLGGLDSVLGAVVGTILISAWQQIMRGVEGAHLPMLGWTIPPGIADLTLGIGFLILLRLRPQGLLGNLELGLRA